MTDLESKISAALDRMEQAYRTPERDTAPREERAERSDAPRRVRATASVASPRRHASVTIERAPTWTLREAQSAVEGRFATTVTEGEAVFVLEVVPGMFGQVCAIVRPAGRVDRPTFRVTVQDLRDIRDDQ